MDMLIYRVETDDSTQHEMAITIIYRFFFNLRVNTENIAIKWLKTHA